MQHIASSYRRLLDTVQQQAGDVAVRLGDGAAPRVVLLTPGPYSETYFEHAYLARYLGLPLVEGGRPDGARRAPVPADRRRPAAGARAVAPPGRRLLRSARAAPRFGARRAGPGAGAARAEPGAGQCPGQRLPRIAGGAGLPARHRAGACSARNWRCRRCRPGGAARRPPGRRCATISSARVLRPAFPGSGDGARRIAAHEVDVMQRRIEADPDAWTVPGPPGAVAGGAGAARRRAGGAARAVARVCHRRCRRPLARAARRPDAGGHAVHRCRCRCSKAAPAWTPGC